MRTVASPTGGTGRQGEGAMTKITEYERGRESMLADVRQWLEGLARHSASAFPSNSSSLLEAEGSGAGLASRGWPHAAPPVQLPPDELEVGDWVEEIGRAHV